ncbi:MAG: hypothetical protein ACI9BD_000929 [Candidatus Marinamargulisbacteria bacterium]
MSPDFSIDPIRKGAFPLDLNNPMPTEDAIEKTEGALALNLNTIARDSKNKKGHKQPTSFDSTLQAEMNDELPIALAEVIAQIKSGKLNSSTTLSKNITALKAYCEAYLESEIANQKLTPQALQNLKTVITAIHYTILEYGSEEALDNFLFLFKTSQHNNSVFRLFPPLCQTLISIAPYPLSLRVQHPVTAKGPDPTSTLKKKLHGFLIHQIPKEKIGPLLHQFETHPYF